MLRGNSGVGDYDMNYSGAMNRKLRPELETVFMMPAENIPISVRAGARVARLGGDISKLVPELLEQRCGRNSIPHSTSFQKRKGGKSMIQ